MSYFRREIDDLAGYVPGEQPRTSSMTKLNTNENPYPPSPRVIEAIRRTATDRLRLYPDPVAQAFRETAGKLLGVPADWIVATNGSDDALTILTRACLSASDAMVAPTPSYGLYRVLADIQGCKFVEKNWSPGPSLPDRFTEGARMAVLPNPNSPTGTRIAPADLLKSAQDAKCLFVVDEAYADFAPDHCVGLVEQCERLVVTRSFSKSYSLAGIRLGFIVAQKPIADVMLKVKDSYNVDSISIAAGTAALEDQDYFRDTRDRILATRRRLEAELSKLGFAVTPSHANFVWVTHSIPLEPIHLSLKARNIFVRYFRYAAHGEGLRISVGTDDEIDQLLSALKACV